MLRLELHIRANMTSEWVAERIDEVLNPWRAFWSQHCRESNLILSNLELSFGICLSFGRISMLIHASTRWVSVSGAGLSAHTAVDAQLRPSGAHVSVGVCRGSHKGYLFGGAAQLRVSLRAAAGFEGIVGKAHLLSSYEFVMLTYGQGFPNTMGPMLSFEALLAIRVSA